MSSIDLQSVTWKIGESVQHQRLEARVFAPEATVEQLPDIPSPAEWPWVLVLGGVHGNETEGVWLVEAAIDRWSKSFSFKKVGVVAWSRVNADGVARGERWNANGIDLNRNLPTKDWTPEVLNPRYPPGPSPLSEPENKALVGLIERIKPVAIFSAHSFTEFQVNVNGPALAWGRRLAEVSGYPLTQNIGYPTPGSLGTWAGEERSIPTITFEIERGLSRDVVLGLHHPHLLDAAIQYWEDLDHGL